VSALAIDDKFEDDITNLIDTGKEKGYLTYGDVNDMLPEDMHGADDLDDLITTIGTQGIDLLDGPKSATKISSSKRARMSSLT